MLPARRGVFDWPSLFGDGWFTETRESYYSAKETEDGYEVEVTIPTGIEVEDIHAEVVGNKLRLTFPKPEPKQIELRTK